MTCLTSRAHREMVSNLAKPGETILNEISPTEAHLLHMLVFGGEFGEIVLAHRNLEAAVERHSGLSRSPISTHAYIDESRELVATAAKALLKDCGDYEFYLTGIRIGLSLDSVDYLEVERTGDYAHRHSALQATALLLELAVVQGDLIDAIKRVVVYRKGRFAKDTPYSAAETAKIHAAAAEQSDRARDALDKITILLSFLYTIFGYTRQQVLQANIDKLTDPDKGRFTAGSYSDKAAVERNDVAPGTDDLSVAPVKELVVVLHAEPSGDLRAADICVDVAQEFDPRTAGDSSGDSSTSDPSSSGAPAESSGSPDESSGGVSESSASEPAIPAEALRDINKEYEKVVEKELGEAVTAAAASLKANPPKNSLGFAAKKAAKKAAKDAAPKAN